MKYYTICKKWKECPYHNAVKECTFDNSPHETRWKFVRFKEKCNTGNIFSELTDITEFQYLILQKIVKEVLENDSNKSK